MAKKSYTKSDNVKAPKPAQGPAPLPNAGSSKSGSAKVPAVKPSPQVTSRG